MPVPFIDLATELAPLRGDLDRAIARVLDSGVFIGGDEVAGFERALAAHIGARHAVGASSGTDALLAILMALEVGPGAEVVTTPFSFFATAGAVARLGARLVFADLDDDTLAIDPAAAARACSDRTRVVLPVHLYGRTAALPEVPVPIVEDAAQALGALWRPGAARGIAAAISFFPTKNLGALGDAGAVVTDDDALAERVTLLRNHGARPKYHHVLLGGNFRLDALQAAVLAARLPHLEAAIAARRSRAAIYDRLLRDAGLPDVRRPAPHPEHTWHQYVIRAPRRAALRAHLAAAGIATEIYYPEPLHLQPCFAALGYRAGSMPVAERAAAEVLALPIQPALVIDQQAAVVDAIAAFYRG